MADETEGFSAEERAAMKERAKEVRPRRGGKKKDTEAELLARVAEMAPSDRALAERIHAIVKENAPELTPKLYYGMPSYARGSDVVFFFQDAGKFKTRYATFGFNDAAHLDDGAMWPTAFAVTELNPDIEAKLAELVKRAVS